MDLENVTEVPDPTVPGEASEPPTLLLIVLWIPAFAVVLWFMVRLFSGRWITDPQQPPVPPRPGEDDGDDALDEDDLPWDEDDDPGAPLADDDRSR